MEFQLIVDNYFSELHNEVEAGQNSGEATSELSYRTSLDNFFKQLAASIDPQIVTIPEPKNQKKIGRPDWRFHNAESMGVYGYVEAKGIDTNETLSPADYQPQIEKYLTLGNPVILTDGIDFIIYDPAGDFKKYSLFEKPINWTSPVVDLSLETLFLEFFGAVGYRTISENQLVGEVAKRSKLLKKEIIEFLHLEEDEAESASELKTLRLIKELQATAQVSHDRTLQTDESFASFIAQILTFGLLFAHRVVANTCEKPIEKYERIHDFWFGYLDVEYTGKLIPFRTLVKGLEEELNSNLSRLGLWYDDLRRLLAHIRLTSQQVEMPDFHELYESFLSIYDPETRFDYGAFYTPRYLAFFITEFSIRIIENSIADVNFYEDSHKIIDPCCGTGTFIEAILEKLSPSNSSKIVGFEILPAPYALTHYRLTMLRDGYPENVKIILTNTLSDNLFIENKDNVEEETLSNMLLREQKSAYNLATPPITLIIGNPPSSDSKFKIDNEGDFIKALINDFRPPASDRTARQNTQKQLSNEFIKFLRWCVDRALNSMPSLFALILPSSFGKHPSYKYARKYLIDHFNELWVLDFDSDNRTGVGDSNLFQTLQGRLHLVGVITSNDSETAIIKYHSINDYSRVEKITYFKNSEIDLKLFETLEVDRDNYSLKPSALYDKEAYSKFWPLSDRSDTGIFYRHCSSIKLAPTHLLVHASLGQLKRRSKFIARPENNYESIKKRWYSGQRKPPSESKITPDVKAKLLRTVQSRDIHSYSYRPFIQTSVLLNNALLSELQKLGGGGTRDRPEIRAAYSDNRVIGFAVSPAPEDIGASIHKFSSFCWNLPDNDLSARGNAHIFCNYFPDYKKRSDWDPTLKDNINQELVNQLCSDFDLNTESAQVNLMFYVYAVLSSEFYMQSFAGKLFTVSGEWPRIPITKDRTSFIAIATIGKTLAELEIKHENLQDGKPDDTTIVYYKYKVGEDRLILIDDKGSVVKEFLNIPKEITGFTVSGYNILREWLKMHSYPYYRKGVGTNEFIKLEILINNINEYLDAIVELDSIVEDVLDGELYKPND